MTPADRLADALRTKDADQRGYRPLAWHWLTEPERTKWRELAAVAEQHIDETRRTA